MIWSIELLEKGSLKIDIPPPPYGAYQRMKMKEIRRMLRTPKKDSSDGKDKSTKKQPPRNKRRAGAKGDDDSVDSHGNIRDLIA